MSAEPLTRGRPRDPGVEPRALRALRQVVALRGNRNTSMSAIAERSSVGKPTLYLRWSGLDEMIAAALGKLRPEAAKVYGERVRACRAAIADLAALEDGEFLVQLLADPEWRDVLAEWPQALQAHGEGLAAWGLHE